MNSVKNVSSFSLKRLYKRLFLPLICLLFVGLLFSSPFLSMTWGQKTTCEIEYVFKMGGANNSANPATYDSAVATPILDACDLVYKFQGWTVEYVDEDVQVLKAQRDFVIPAGKSGKIILSAVFDTNIPKYAIEYKLDGGVNNPSNVAGYAADNQPYPVVIYAPSKLGYMFLGWTAVYSDGTPSITSSVSSFQIEDGTQGAITLTAHWILQQQVAYTVKFLPGDANMADFEARTHYPVYYGDDMPVPPHPYAQFGCKFLGWRANDDKGTFYPALDYTKPEQVVGFPETVTGDVEFVAEWAVVNANVKFPDKISSAEHFDKWWGDYGILCFAASTTKDDVYTVMFADWFFNVYRNVTIGYGTPGKMSYEIVFTETDITLWEIKGNGDRGVFKTKGDGIEYSEEMTCIRGGHYYTKEKNHNYGLDFGMKGLLHGVSFINPFGNGAKQAWLYSQ